MEFWDGYLMIGAFAGAVVALPVCLVVYILRKMYYVPFARKKQLKDAHTVEAKCIPHSIRHGEPGDPILVKYRYEVNGRKYTFSTRIHDRDIPHSITLYYLGDDPRKANYKEFLNEIGNAGIWGKIYLAAWAVSTVVCAVAIALISFELQKVTSIT